MSVLEASTALGLGLLAGVHHAATGPDHLAGVAPFAARAGRAAWRVGVAWGLGHASGAALAAVVALVLRAALPGVEERLSAVSETLVGILLCAIGFLGLVAVVRGRTRRHAHAHDAGRDGHAREHDAGRGGHEHDHAPLAHRRPAFLLGAFHGAAGLAHLFGVLPALAFPGRALPAIYLGGYAAGSLAAIAAFAIALGWTGSRARAPRASLAITSAASLCVGVAWLVSTL